MKNIRFEWRAGVHTRRSRCAQPYRAHV